MLNLDRLKIEPNTDVIKMQITWWKWEKKAYRRGRDHCRRFLEEILSNPRSIMAQWIK